MERMTLEAATALFDAEANPNPETTATSKPATIEAVIAALGPVSRYPEITVEQCGGWLWITGNTRPLRGELKALGCRWSPNKGCWYWAPAGYRRKGRPAPLARIRAVYGSRLVADES